MKKKSFVVLTVIIALAFTGCSKSEFRDDPLGIFKEKEEEDSTEQSSSNQFVFKAPKIKTKPVIAEPAKDIKGVKMYLGDDMYYTVEIPKDFEVITDNSSYMYSKDNSLYVSVVSNVPRNEFSTYVQIKNAENVSKNIIKSPDNKRGPQEAAINFTNDKGIIVRTYDNPKVFATILNGLKNNDYNVTQYNGMVVSEKSTKVLKKIPSYEGYKTSVSIGLGDEVQNIYQYKDGSLTIAREFKQWKQANQSVGTKLATILSSNIADKVFISDAVSYIEKGNYTIGAVSINYNTTLTLFGNGKEARYNITKFLKGYNTH